MASPLSKNETFAPPQNLEQLPSSMEETNPNISVIGQSSHPIPTIASETSPDRFSPDSSVISTILQELHEQNPSLRQNKEINEALSEEIRVSDEVQTNVDVDSENKVEGDGLNIGTEIGVNQELEDEDNMPIAFVWKEKRRLVTSPTIQKGEATYSRKNRPLSTRSSLRILMNEAMVANKVQTYQNRRKRKQIVHEEDTSGQDVADISSQDNENDIEKSIESKKKSPSKGKKTTNGSKKKQKKKGSSRQSVEKGKRVVKEADTTNVNVFEPNLGVEKDSGFSPELSREERGRILRTQRVLSGRVIDPEYADRPGMIDLVDAIEMQGWSHLFLEWPVPTLHEKEVKDFYCNMRLNDDGSLDTAVNYHRIHLTELIISKILKVNREGITTVAKTSPSPDFITEILKGSNYKRTSVPKKFMKGTFQLFFEFVNKVLLPRSEKRTVATASDLYLMESLSKMDDINLSSILMEHFRKILTTKDGKHGLAYGYLIGRIMKHNDIPLGVGIKGTIKQAMSLHTLIECECVEDREGKSRKSQISELLEIQEQLRHELMGMSQIIQQKDVEIAKLKAGMGQTSEAGPSNSSVLLTLHAENALLKEEKAQLSAQVNDLKDKLIHSHEESAATMSLLLKHLPPKP